MTGNFERSGIVLAIESAVSDGSLAVLDSKSTLALSDGVGSRPSRAEEILKVVDELLARAGIKKSDIGLIAVSIGPGSYSGIRIGLATAFGLKQALNVACIGVSVLEAMAASGKTESSRLITAVPVGKKDVAWQEFVGESNHTLPELTNEQEFIDMLSKSAGSTLLAPSNFLSRIAPSLPKSIDIVDAGDNLARYVGILAVGRAPTEIQPLYLRNKAHSGQPLA